MANKILSFVINCFLLASCSASTEESPSIETSPPSAAILLTAIPVSTQTLSSTRIAPPAAITPTPTDAPWWYSIGYNPDGSWYFNNGAEYTINIYQSDNAAPVISINQFDYYPDFPETSYPIFTTNDTPIPAGWSDPVWSPDGRYLAFLGAIEGPSSDLYVFDTSDQTINRLTSGENQAVFPEWSPDSAWIVHGEMKLVDDPGDDGYDAVWAAKPDGSEIKWLLEPQGWFYIVGWIDENSFYSAGSWMGEYVKLQLTYIDSGEVITIFDFSDSPWVAFPHNMVFDANTGALVYVISSIAGDFPEYDDGGLYLSTPSEPIPRWLVSRDVDPFDLVNRWDSEAGVFIICNYCDDDGDLYYSVSPQGEVSCVEYTP